MTAAYAVDIDDLSTAIKAETKPVLWACWIDTNLGYYPPDWEMNSPPKAHSAAEQESSECWARGFPAVILPEGHTPRRDGLFSNPATDPQGSPHG